MALGMRDRGDFERRREPVLSRFVFSSDLLRECARRVDYTRSWRERTAYLLGEADGNGRRVVTRIVEVPGVGEPVFGMDRTLTLLEHLATAARDGWELLGVAHSHPEWFPAPSRLDWAVQVRLELCYDLIGVLFGFGGYLRFYRLRPYQLEIRGEGIEEVRPGAVYRLLPRTRGSGVDAFDFGSTAYRYGNAR